MIKDQSYWIIPVYKNDDWSFEFLIIDQKSSHGSFWWFPKWHPEGWEDGIMTAKREFQEEVGIWEIKIIKDKYFDMSYIFKDKWEKIDKTVRYWLGFVKSKSVSIQKKELNWYKRLDFDSAMKILSHENTKNILKEVIKEI